MVTDTFLKEMNSSQTSPPFESHALDMVMAEWDRTNQSPSAGSSPAALCETAGVSPVPTRAPIPVVPLSRPASSPERRSGRDVLARVWLVGWLAVAGLLLWAAAPGQHRQPERSPAPAPVEMTETRNGADEPGQSPESPSTRKFIPIQQATLGRRVKAHNPLLTESERNVPEPTAETHRAASFRLPKPDGSVVEADLLVPVEWLLEIGARIGDTVELDLEEQGASGPAEVLSIGPCPDIRPGLGAIVTGVFRHTAAEVLNLYVEGDEEPLGVTPNHPIWSADRKDFIPAGELRIGENLQTSDGRFLVVTNITSRGPPEPVYNIQVHGEHVYHVGPFGVLVHNNSMLSITGRRPDTLVIGGGRAPGYPRHGSNAVTVDINPRALPDIVADGRHLPFRSNSFSEVFIERLPYDVLDTGFFRESARVLDSGGRLRGITGSGANLTDLRNALRNAGFRNVTAMFDVRGHAIIFSGILP